MNIINSVNNPIVKRVNSLKRKKYRYESGLYIIEGLKLLEEALKCDITFDCIIYSERFRDSNGAHDIINKTDIKTFELSEKVFSRISELENDQGIMAIVKQSWSSYEEIKKEGIYIYLDGLQDPGNLGTILRTADAFNISGAFVGKDNVDPYNPKVIRATMGSIFRIKLFDVQSLETLYKIKSSHRLISTTPLAGISLDEFSFENGDIIAIGNEGAGISKALLESSDYKLKIKMRGSAESLNAGVAASIILYEATKAKY